MTLERANILYEGWAEQGPPIHISLAAYVGFKPTRRPTGEVLEGEQLVAAMPHMPGAGGAQVVEEDSLPVWMRT